MLHRNRAISAALYFFSLASLSLSGAAHAQPVTETIARWSFNSAPPDANTATGTPAPAVGSGVASLVGTSASFATADTNGGSSDPATTDDSGWAISGFAPQGTGSQSRGVQFNLSTLGFENIVLSFDIRHSNTSSRYEAVQYSLDGISFMELLTFEANAGDTWFNGRSVDFSGVAGVSDNASFAVRIVSTFAPGASAYAATNSGSNYGTSGAWRFDQVAVTGSAVSPVPEPGSVWLMLAGLAAASVSAMRTRREAAGR